MRIEGIVSDADRELQEDGSAEGFDASASMAGTVAAASLQEH